LKEVDETKGVDNREKIGGEKQPGGLLRGNCQSKKSAKSLAVLHALGHAS
jgi:hypothetical protein